MHTAPPALFVGHVEIHAHVCDRRAPKAQCGLRASASSHCPTGARRVQRSLRLVTHAIFRYSAKQYCGAVPFENELVRLKKGISSAKAQSKRAELEKEAAAFEAHLVYRRSRL